MGHLARFSVASSEQLIRRIGYIRDSLCRCNPVTSEAVCTANSLTWADFQGQLCARQIQRCLVAYLYCWIFRLLIGLYRGELVIIYLFSYLFIIYTGISWPYRPSGGRSCGAAG